jgi:hypothetical protein
MSVEIRGTWNGRERSIVLENSAITGDEEVRNYLATHTSDHMREQPLEYTDRICEALVPIFGATLWRADTPPAAVASPAPAPAAMAPPPPAPAASSGEESSSPRRPRP